MLRPCALLAALPAVLLVAACADSDTLDSKMKPMVGANEPALVAAMGRTPDATFDRAPGVKVLRWRWEQPYAVPDRMLAYTYSGGAIRPIANTPIGMVRNQCLAEWTLSDGIATQHRVEGSGCPAMTALARP